MDNEKKIRAEDGEWKLKIKDENGEWKKNGR